MTTITAMFRTAAAYPGTEGFHPFPPPHDVHDAPPSGVITPEHPAWQRWHDQAVWGTLAGLGAHNPFYDADPEPQRWKTRSNTHHFWKHIREQEPASHAAAQAAMHKAIGNAHIAMAMSTPALHGVLDDGRVKSGFETGRNFSGDLINRNTTYLGMRRDQEDDHFGYSHDHPDGGRPVYGYLTHHPYTDDTTRGYGEHTLVVSPNLSHRTTWTGGDSLNLQKHVRPSPKTAPDLRSVPRELTDRPYSDRPGDQDLGLRESLGHHHYRSGYLEAQIHGGVPLSQVHYAILRTPDTGDGQRQAKELGARLSDRGVPWIHMPPHDDVFSHLRLPTAPTWDHSSPRKRQGLAMTMNTREAAVGGAFDSRYDPQVRWHQGGTRYIIELADPGRLGMAFAQVADLEWGRLYPKAPLDSILSRGYWEPLAHPVDAGGILSRVRPA